MGDAGRDTFVLGLNCYDHDVAACLLRNGEVVVAIAKERITRIKHDAGFYGEVTDYCLDAAGIPLGRLDLVVRGSYQLPVPELERLLAKAHDPYHLRIPERRRAIDHPLFRTASERVVTCSHHLAHAYSAFAASPFDEGAVMVVDGLGSHRIDVTEPVPAADEAHPLAREAESYYVFRGASIEPVKKVFMGPSKGILSDEFWGMPGIGARYSRVSTYVFGNWNRCGEVMGLAPYGHAGAPRHFEVRNGEIEIHPWPEEHDHPFLTGPDERWERSRWRREWEDLAWRVQEDTERALVARARELHERTGATDLCLAGGVALNCVANARILEETPFRRVFIQPAAGDDGTAMGCALYGHLAVRGGKRAFELRSPALGSEHGDAEVGAALSPPAVRIATRTRRVGDVADRAAALLAEGKVVGWFQGRSEFGPRALGHRSILADPRRAETKDRLNARVKLRQSFRPFAPAVPLERADEYFEGGHESPFMILVRRVRPQAREKIPAVVHVDGTARVQTVRATDEPLFHALLTAFGRRTGVPVLLNTSFNIRGMPIVETPEDAVECFLRTGIDALAIGDRIVTKTAVHRTFAPLVRLAMRLRRNLTTDALARRAAEQILSS